MTGLVHFSTDAASNGTAAPPILFPEDMPANAVNNSARALMAALACWREDTNGSLAASGAATNVLSVATNQNFSDADVARPFDLAFTVDAANTGAAVLIVDGRPAKLLVRRDNQLLGPGDLQPGPRYRVARTPNLDGNYVVVEPTLEPAGTIKAFASEAAIPKGWVPCDGRALARIPYAALFFAIGSAYGAGDGATTFAIPDLRGRSPFCVDQFANGTAAGRLTGVGGLAGGIGAGGGAEQVALALAQMPSHGHTGTATAGGGVAAGTTGGGGDHDHGAATGLAGRHTHGGTAAAAGAHTHSGTTSAAGGHTHGVTTASSKVGVAGSGSTNGGLWNGADASLNSASAGSHSHDLTIDGVADHTHGLSIATIGDHGHAITAAGAHTHSTPAIPDHSHPVTIAAAGSGQAHPNMPPGLVVVFAIKA